MSDKTFYITTPIYFPSGKWHLGTCYTTVICDAIARFKRMQGMDVFYLTGTDEHGQKIQDVAAAAGVPVKEFVDDAVAKLKTLWKKLDISYDKYIRTTDEMHERAVQEIFTRLYEKGDIYKGEYEGLYCTPCESFWTPGQLKDGKCPDCGRDVVKTKEESYFFRLSKYQDRVMQLIENDPEFLLPKSRQNEMLNNFLRPGLQDISVTRTSFDWGIRVPFDDKHVIYVWIDALTNYITALGYTSGAEELFDRFWPADIHMMAKEIVRFHSIIWPALLMALDLPLPKKVFGHGWLLMNGDKMSKSKGNVFDPDVLSDLYTIDAVRYYLLREIPFGNDGTFTIEAFLSRINADLVNVLGNLVSRTTAMITQSFDAKIPLPDVKEAVDDELIACAEALYGQVEKDIDALKMPEALEHIFALLERANKYIDETKPWVLAKSEDGKPRLKTVLYNLAETIRIAAVLLQPFLTQCSGKIFEKLGIHDDYLKKLNALQFGTLPAGLTVNKGEALFERLNIEKEVRRVNDYSKPEAQATAAATGGKEEKPAQRSEPNASGKPAAEFAAAAELGVITIDDFAKIKLKAGTVVACERVENAQKLLKLSVDLGEGAPRTIVSGIAEWYTPEQMPGKQVIVVSNLKPAKLRGIVSEGMILCAAEGKTLCIVTPEQAVNAGMEVR